MKYGWSLDLEAWRRLQDIVKDYEWRRAPLENLYKSKVPELRGVYMICGCPKDIPVRGQVMNELYNVLYVGQASNLRRRFQDHVRGYRNVVRAKSIFRKLDFWYCKTSDTEVNLAEQQLMEAFGPSANVVYVKAKIGSPVPAG
ncbi:MAG: GIY-YIG nuclease family protein [Gammaproteobacteria bacterium]|nr:GIY-YIG nuclease family protein [Gammaproteobacteria bacterium]